MLTITILQVFLVQKLRIDFQSTAYAQNPRMTDESAVFIGSSPMVGVSLSSNQECVPASGSAVMKASVSMTLPPKDILVNSGFQQKNY